MNVAYIIEAYSFEAIYETNVRRWTSALHFLNLQGTPKIYISYNCYTSNNIIKYIIGNIGYY